ncbi:MAG: GNAT family N-acetyltransferase [Nanoarchaeota archaeon]|nr:GNAT family N-acetyltransferase [Nanoarchaeota archaeon]
MEIKLRKYREKDLERHLELFLMNGIYKKINEKIKNQEKIWLKKVIQNYEGEKPEFFTIAINLDNKLIGNLVAEKIDYKNKTLEVGFWIGKDYWGKGVATKALNLFLKMIIKKFNPKKIIAHHKKGNFASGRVLEKAGFKFEIEKKGMKTYNIML